MLNCPLNVHVYVNRLVLLSQLLTIVPVVNAETATSPKSQEQPMFLFDLIFLRFVDFYFLCTSICPHISVHTTCVCGAWEGQIWILLQPPGNLCHYAQLHCNLLQLLEGLSDVVLPTYNLTGHFYTEVKSCLFFFNVLVLHVLPMPVRYIPLHSQL